MNKQLSTIQTKLMDHRNTKRIWLEGKKIEQAGFLRGKRIRVCCDQSKAHVTILLDPSGGKIVSGRIRNGKTIPIIDLCDKEFGLFLNATTLAKLEAVVCEGLITISKPKSGEA